MNGKIVTLSNSVSHKCPTTLFIIHPSLLTQPLDPSELASVEEDMDSVSAHIEYVQENIIELQNDLIALDDSKSDGDTVEAHAIITSSSPREAKYLLEHLLDMVLDLVS